MISSLSYSNIGKFFQNLRLILEISTYTFALLLIILILTPHISQSFIDQYIAGWNVSKFGVVSSPYFLEFGLITEIYSVNLGIQYKCGMIRTRKTANLWLLHYFNVISKLIKFFQSKNCSYCFRLVAHRRTAKIS